MTIDKAKAVRAVPRGTIWWRMYASHQLAAVTWLDNKPVTILTTAVSPIDATNELFVGRWHKNAVKDISCSPTLVHYQNHVRGVDVQDQLQGNYSVQTRDHKWWHRILLHLLDTSLVNAYILYRARMQKMGESVMSWVKFHYEVATKVCTSSVQRMRFIPHRVDIPNPDALHYTLFSTRGEEKATRRKCIICGKRQQFYYPTCGDIPVCMGECFMTRHS